MSFYGVRLIFVPNPSTMVHSEWAFLVHVYGNFHLQVALLLEETQNCPYRMIISNTSRYSISDYISASESRGPFVAQVCFDPVAETGSFRWATATRRLPATPTELRHFAGLAAIQKGPKRTAWRKPKNYLCRIRCSRF